MAARYQFIHKAKPSRAAVLVYALVFTIVAAVVLYVSATIWQARQRADVLREYASERWLVDWGLKQTIRAAYQFSLDSGYGLDSGDDWTKSWYSVYYKPVSNAPSFPTSYVNSSESASEGDYIDFDLLYPTAPASNSTSGTQTVFGAPPNDYLWTVGTAAGAGKSLPVGLIATTDSYAAGNPAFGASDIFGIPGYRPRFTNAKANTPDLNPSDATWAPYGGNSAQPVPFQTNEGGFNFVWFNNSVYYLTNRGDLPFFQPSGAYNNMGLWRWVREGLQYYLYTKAGDTNNGTANNGINEDPLEAAEAAPITNYVWSVEEPITNYQLLLLDPSVPWKLGGSAGSITLSSNANLARMFVWGNIDPSFSSGNPPIEGDGSNPIAALVGQQPSSTAANMLSGNSTALGYFNWCVARPSTRVSFGRGNSTYSSGIAGTAGTPGGSTNPNYPLLASGAPVGSQNYGANSLESFLTSSVIGRMNTTGMTVAQDVDDERQLNIRNTAGLPMPAAINGAGYEFINACYINPVLCLTSQGGLQWSQQSDTGALGSVMDGMQLPYNSTTSPPSEDSPPDIWNPIQLAAPPNEPPPGPPYPTNRKTIPGFTGIHSYDHGVGIGGNRDAVEITIDLGLFGNPATEAAGVTGVNNTLNPWCAPREIYIWSNSNAGPGILPPATLVVKIIGDAHDTGANLLPPVKIVVFGEAVSSRFDIRLVPDPSAGMLAANYRRFILEAWASTNTVPSSPAPAQISFEPVNINNTSPNQSYTWYGVILGPSGLTFGNSGTASVSNGVEINSKAAPASASVKWFGTILACQSIALGELGSPYVGLPAISSGTLNLTISPDDGGGTLSSGLANGYQDPYSTYMLFTPWFNQQIPAPVPPYASSPLSMTTTPMTPNPSLMGRPVPMMVPRMVWNFENETYH